ncbi:hypothetical protein Q7P35_004156 [Cladosporium inversicolor]
MSNGHDDGGNQDDGQGGREIEIPANGSVHSPPRRYGDAPVMGRYPSRPNGTWYTRGSQRYRIIPGYNDRDYDSDEYSEEGPVEPGENPVEPDGDPDGLADPAPPYEDHMEEQLLQVPFASVTTQRALRRKLKELRKCQQDIQDAKLVARSYQTALRELEPTTDGEWSMFRATEANIRDWETKASEKQDLETRISLQVEFLEDRADDEARSSQASSQDYSQLSRERSWRSSKCR